MNEAQYVQCLTVYQEYQRNLGTRKYDIFHFDCHVV